MLDKLKLVLTFEIQLAITNASTTPDLNTNENRKKRDSTNRIYCQKSICFVKKKRKTKEMNQENH